MPTGGVILASAALAAAFWGGTVAYNKAIKPAACAVVKVATVGKKHCAPKPQKAKTSK